LEPRLQISVDSRKAVVLDVKPDDAAQTARIATGGALAYRARLSSGLVDVIVRANGGERGDMQAIRDLKIRSGNGQLVPLHDVAALTNGTQPGVIERENRERVVAVTANAVGSAPIGLVTGPMRKLLSDPTVLVSGARIAPRGDVEQFLDTVVKMVTALGLSIVVVYAILAMLYKSYTLPFIIMTTVPLAAVGAFGSLYGLNVLHVVFPGPAVFEGQTLNLYSMLGTIMLVGLVAKNGILLVEYAEREMREGRDAATAISLAAGRRFRPIVMTTFAMIGGMLPLALGDTIGAEYRKALGSVVIGGLLSSLLLTLFVLPIAYVAWRSRKATPAFLSRDITVAIP
nr:efflux RND transporter permease subunit [Candidatus Eremiobacteraeota bacterium]